jgi:hypothetical protein
MQTISLNKIGAEFISKGAEADFYHIKWRGESVGLKLFPSQSDCDAVKFQQRKAAKAGIGPAVKSPTFKVIRGRSDWDIGYGYLTELASVDENRCYPERELDKLDEEFYEVFGFFHPDFHEGNIGYLSNGKLVYIDFGFEE